MFRSARLFECGYRGLDVVIVNSHFPEKLIMTPLLNDMLSQIISNGIPCLENMDFRAATTDSSVLFGKRAAGYFE